MAKPLPTDNPFVLTEQQATALLENADKTRALKKELEEHIAEVLQDFTRKTGMTVTSLYVDQDFVWLNSNHEKHYRVEASVELK